MWKVEVARFLTAVHSLQLLHADHHANRCMILKQISKDIDNACWFSARFRKASQPTVIYQYLTHLISSYVVLCSHYFSTYKPYLKLIKMRTLFICGCCSTDLHFFLNKNITFVWCVCVCVSTIANKQMRQHHLFQTVSNERIHFISVLFI